MKIKKYFTLLLLCASIHTSMAQSNYFTTISYGSTTHVTETRNDSTTFEVPYTASAKDSMSLQEFLAGLSVQELEYLNNYYSRRYQSVAKVVHNVKTEKGVPLKYYNGESHPLTIMNLLAVMKEVGISNRIFVLAQALLETGYFKSNVCKTCNNLFGLYDSRHKRYYSFERWEDSVVGYYKFIQYRYKGGNYLSFLQRIGYAEDPKYISKVCDISKKLNKMEFIVD